MSGHCVAYFSVISPHSPSKTEEKAITPHSVCRSYTKASVSGTSPARRRNIENSYLLENMSEELINLMEQSLLYRSNDL